MNCLMLMGMQLVKESVFKDVEQVTVWSVIADETADRNKKEVMLLPEIRSAARQRVGIEVHRSHVGLQLIV